MALSNKYLRTAFVNIGRLFAHWRVQGVSVMPELTLDQSTAPQAGIRTAHPVRNDGDDMVALSALAESERRARGFR